LLCKWIWNAVQLLDRVNALAPLHGNSAVADVSGPWRDRLNGLIGFLVVPGPDGDALTPLQVVGKRVVIAKQRCAAGEISLGIGQIRQQRDTN
jgi:hypothetical protein